MYSYISENNFGPSNQILVPTGYNFVENVLNKTGNVRINVTLRRVRATIVAVENQ
jgi:hypothetical protein